MYYPANWPYWEKVFNLGIRVGFSTKVQVGIDDTEYYLCPALGVSVERYNGESEEAVYARLYKLMDERFYALTGEQLSE